MISADIIIFSPEIGKFCYIKKYRYRLHCTVAKMATLGLPKIQVFLKEDYDVIVSVYDVINKILLRDSDYTVDVVM